MKCETCMHWAKWKHEDYLGSCKKVARFWETRDWDGSEITMYPEHINTKFFVQDAEDYAAYLYTRNDFGCVEYMEKANEHV